MAGRIVILEFDDKDSALQLVRDDVTMEAWNCTPMAVFLRPNVFCTCDPSKREQLKNWIKGKRTGIYLCGTCRKPSRFHRDGIMGRLEYLFGYNRMTLED